MDRVQCVKYPGKVWVAWGEYHQDSIFLKQTCVRYLLGACLTLEDLMPLLYTTAFACTNTPVASQCAAIRNAIAPPHPPPQERSNQLSTNPCFSGPLLTPTPLHNRLLHCTALHKHHYPAKRSFFGTMSYFAYSSPTSQAPLPGEPAVFCGFVGVCARLGGGKCFWEC